MKMHANPWLIRLLFAVALIGSGIQALLSAQAHSWPAFARAFAIVCVALIFIARPQLLLRPFPFSTDEVNALPLLLKGLGAVAGVLLAASFLLQSST